MSYVVTVSTSSVLYTPPNGAENAFAGQTIASATWNSIFTDLSNNGLAVVGTAQANTIKGNTTSAVGVVADMTVAQAQTLMKTGLLCFSARAINFNPSIATDIAVSITVPTSRYRFDNFMITNASASLTAASVGLYTAVGGGGVTIIGSTTLIVSATAVDTLNNMQSVQSSNLNTMCYNDATLQVRILVPAGAPATADVILYVRPM